MAPTYITNNGWFITRILCCTLFFLWLFFLWREPHIIHMTFRYVVTFPSSRPYIFLVEDFKNLAALPKRRVCQLYRRYSYERWVTLPVLRIPQTVTRVTRYWFELWPENRYSWVQCYFSSSPRLDKTPPKRRGKYQELFRVE
jgi:hypothetical protein